LPELWEAPFEPLGGQTPFNLEYVQGETRLPARRLANGEWGGRWNQLLPGGEFSISYLSRLSDLGSVRPRAVAARPGPIPQVTVALDRQFYRAGVLGFDFASRLWSVGIRGEAALFHETDPREGNRLVWVVGLDRTWHGWLFIVEYLDRSGGDSLVGVPAFSTLAVRSTLLSHIQKTIGSSHELELRGALGLHGGGHLVEASYGRALSGRLRLKASAIVIGGARAGYLGQYGDNGHLKLDLRYSF
jgi:hypothetical protein